MLAASGAEESAVRASLTLREILRAVWRPLTARMRLGEGVLLAVNLSVIVGHARGLPRTGVEVAVSALTLTLLYAWNDLADAPGDRANAKKDPALVALFLRHARPLSVVLLALEALLVLAAAAALDVRIAAAIAVVFLLNAAYSRGIKGVPVLDVIWVALCGAGYAAVAATPAFGCALVGIITGMCHLYQALGDRAVDVGNRIRTTAALPAAAHVAVLLAWSLGLCAVLASSLSLPIAVSGLVPFAAFLVLRHPGRVWLLTKAYFGVLWLGLLGWTGLLR